MLTKSGYIPRLIDNEITELLEIFGCVEIDGPKWCGKTWTALNHCNSQIRLDDDETRQIVEADPKIALLGDSPHLIDEWQRVPSIRDCVRRSVDETSNSYGLYILTGSATPAKDKVAHSGAGRIALVQMRPLSLSEAGISDSSISLYGLFEKEFIEKQIDVDLNVLAEAICRGGWPGSAKMNLERALRVPRQYLSAIYNFSAPRVGKDSDLSRLALIALSRNISESVSIATLAKDMSAGEYESHPERFHNKAEEYVNFYRDIYILEELPGWDAPVKSRARTRTKPKRYLVDPSLATAALSISPTRLLSEMQVFGHLFETLCIRDIRTYLSANAVLSDAKLYYYRDDYGLEVDVIIEVADGRWAAIEIKLSENKVQEGIDSLLRLREKIRSNPASQNRDPEFMAVLVGRTTFARISPEGVFIIPITCLTA